MHRTLAIASLMIAVVAVYANSLDGAFVFDDIPAIVQNDHVRSLWPLTQSLTAPTEATTAGRPVAAFSFALDYAVGEYDTWIFHATNVAIHLCATLALFGVVRRTLLSPPLTSRFGASSTLLAFLIALLWAVHPLQTQSVTYLVQRVESLMGLFLLLTLYCAIRAGERFGLPSTTLESGKAVTGSKRKAAAAGANRTMEAAARDLPDSRRAPRPAVPPGFRVRAADLWSIASVVACALGMATKQVMVGAPLLVLLWDWTFGQRLRWKLYIALASTWLLLGYLVASAPRPHSVGSFEGWTPLVYLATQAGVILHYLRLVVAPFPLVFDYDWPPARGMVQIGVPGIIVAALVALTLVGVFRRRPWAFAGAWFFVILAPSSSVLPIVTEVAAEHRMYLPLAAVLSLIVLSAYGWSARTRRPWLVPAVCLVLAIVLGARTIARNRDYESDERIWADTVEKRPTNSRARNNYAIDLLKTGRLGDAEAHARAALDSTPAGQEGPRMAEVHQTLGVILLSTGRPDEGITELRRALDLDPTYGKAYQNLGEAYGAKGDLASAARAFVEAVRYLPDDAFVLNRAGWLLATAPDDRIRDGARALTLAQHAVDVTRRRDVNSLDTLAAAHAERGEFDAAVTAEQEALDLAHANGDAAMAPELQERLSIYQARRPFRTR